MKPSKILENHNKSIPNTSELYVTLCRVLEYLAEQETPDTVPDYIDEPAMGINSFIPDDTPIDPIEQAIDTYGELIVIVKTDDVPVLQRLKRQFMQAITYRDKQIEELIEKYQLQKNLSNDAIKKVVELKAEVDSLNNDCGHHSKQETPDTDIPCDKCIHGTTCQHCDTDYNMFEQNTPDTVTSEDNALEKARGLHGEVILDSSTDGMLAMEMAVHYETALQQERERAEHIKSILVKTGEELDAYKAVLQELEKEIYKYDFGGFVLRAIQDLKNKHGVDT
jgi:hypothetical protein